MTNPLIAFTYYLLAWVLLSIVLSWASAALYPYFSQQLKGFRPEQTTRSTFIFSVLAPITAGLSTLILASPQLAFPLVASHCHNESCEPHTLHIEMSSMLSSSSLALGAAAIIVLSLSIIWQLRGNHRHERMLQQLSEADSLGYRWFESSKPIARCIGLFKPQVYFSSGLLKTMSTEQRKIILAQYLARAARHENLSYWILKWATIAWPQKIKQRVRQEFLQRSASSCDVKAFNVLGEKVKPSSFIKTLESVYCQAQHSMNQTQWQARQDTFEQELQTLHYHGSAMSMPSLSTAFKLIMLGLVFVVGSVYLGHPMLEIFSR